MFSLLLFILVGIIIWLVGGGGGIFAIPTLVYGFHIDPLLATFYSMIIVGSTSVIGTFLAHNRISWKTGFHFAIPSIIITVLTRRYILPTLPEHLWILEKSTYLLILFTFIMFASGCSMICKKKSLSSAKNTYSTHGKILRTWLRGGVVGFITGLVWAGVGFLIVPALMFFEWLEGKKAIATSMSIISLNMLIGAAWRIPPEVDTAFLATLVFIAVGGLTIGLFLQKYLASEHLTQGFGYFTMTAAVVMLSKELFF